MGVPGLFPWFREKFSHRIVPLRIYKATNEVGACDLEEEKISGGDTKHAWDCLHLDLNGFIHVAAAKEMEEAGAVDNLELIFRRVAKAIEDLVHLIRPAMLVNLAMDGVAPRAKINQQRARRYKSSAEKQKKFKLFEMEGKNSNEEKQGEETTNPRFFDSNVISPGTEFMELLSV